MSGVYLYPRLGRYVIVQTFTLPPSVIIFDWDDTLLCTSFLNLRLPTPEVPPQVQKQLRQLETVGDELLRAAMKLGQTFIITNAMRGWVEYSAQKYVPKLLDTLSK